MSERIEPPFMSGRLFALDHEMTSDDWYTPAWMFDRMGVTFDLDVCAPPGGVPWVPAARFLTVTDDGLTQPWTGRVWMNPPYSAPRPWIERFAAHRDGVALLIHSKSHAMTRLWADADGWAVVPPPVRFTGAPNSLPYPLSIVAYGAECVAAIARIGVVRHVA